MILSLAVGTEETREDTEEMAVEMELATVTEEDTVTMGIAAVEQGEDMVVVVEGGHTTMEEDVDIMAVLAEEDAVIMTVEDVDILTETAVPQTTTCIMMEEDVAMRMEEEGVGVVVMARRETMTVHSIPTSKAPGIAVGVVPITAHRPLTATMVIARSPTE